MGKVSQREQAGENLIVRHGAVLGLSILAVLVPAMASGGGSLPVAAGDGVLTVAWQPNPAHSQTKAAGAISSTAALSEAVSEASTVADHEADTAPPAVVNPEPEPELWATMELREGDTLFALAEWFGVSAWDIAAVNGVTIDDTILIGETVVIPVPESQFVAPPAPSVIAFGDYADDDYREPAAEPPPLVVTETVEPPAPAPPPAARPEDVIAAICSLPWPCDQMVRIATCESGLNPNAQNPAGYYGLFQIDYAFDGWNDPWVNARVAYERKYLPSLAHGDALAPWPYCRYR